MSLPGPRIAFEPGWFGSMNSGVIGGLLILVIAVVLVRRRLGGGAVFLYPPVLLVISFISMVKGIFGGSELGKRLGVDLALDSIHRRATLGYSTNSSFIQMKDRPHAIPFKSDLAWN